MKFISGFALATATAAVQLGQQNTAQSTPYNYKHWPHQLATIAAYCDAMDGQWDGNWEPVQFKKMLQIANVWQMRNYGLNYVYLSIPEETIDNVPDAFDDDFNKRVDTALAGELGKKHDEASLRAWLFIEQIAQKVEDSKKDADPQTANVIFTALMYFLNGKNSPYVIWAYPFQKDNEPLEEE